MTTFETARNNGIYYINKIASCICVIVGALLALCTLDGVTPYPWLNLACSLLFAIAGVVALRSCRKYKLIGWALVLYIAALGLLSLLMILNNGKIDIATWILELIPVLVNAIRLFWFTNGKEDRLAEPPKRIRAPRSSHKWRSASSGKKAWKKDDFGGGTGDYMVDEVMNRYGITERQARARIRSCQRDLDAAMDDGYMEELEDIVAEQLGDSSYTDDLI